MPHNQMVKQAIALAHRHLDLEPDDDGAALFALICDLTSELAKIYDADREIPEGEVEEYLAETKANTLASVIANICPGYMLADDKIYQYPSYEFKAVRTAEESGLVRASGRGPIAAQVNAEGLAPGLRFGGTRVSTKVTPVEYKIAFDDEEED